MPIVVCSARPLRHRGTCGRDALPAAFRFHFRPIPGYGVRCVGAGRTPSIHPYHIANSLLIYFCHQNLHRCHHCVCTLERYGTYLSTYRRRQKNRFCRPFSDLIVQFSAEVARNIVHFFFSFFAIFTRFIFPAAVPTYLSYYYYCPQHSNRARTNLNIHTYDTGRQPPATARPSTDQYFIDDSWGEQQRSSLYNTDSSTHGLRPLGTILLPTIRRGARRREFSCEISNKTKTIL